MNKLWLFYRLHRLGFRARPEPAFVAQLEQRLFGKTQTSRVSLPRLASVSLALILVVGSYVAWTSQKTPTQIPTTVAAEKAIQPLEETGFYEASLDELELESQAFPAEEPIFNRLAYQKTVTLVPTSSEESEQSFAAEIDALIQSEL